MKKFDVRGRILDMFTKSESMVSVTVVFLGFLAGTLLVLMVQRNPLGIYSAVVQVVSGWDLRRGIHNVRYIGEWIVASLPLILCGLSMGFAAKTGLFNIGAEGQYIVGLTAAQLVGLFGPQVPIVHWALACLAGACAGAVWGGISGWLKARFSVSEVVSTIMMNYIAFYASRFITLRIPGANTFRTPPFPETARLSSRFLESITNNSRLGYGLFLVIGAVFLYWFIIEKTTLGFSLRATGLNKEAARYCGINVNASLTTAMSIAGAFAGLAGAIVSLGLFPTGRVLSVQEGYGFDGIAVALVGNCTALGISMSGLLFGMLKSAQPLMQSRQIPKEITSIIMGLMVIFISLRAGVKILADWRMKEKVKKRSNQ
ncbi:MAG: ABC transporter permease [Treponema sp.]|jgi:simple sugar transport system permease protein|nr:ABC transporter permease [Treponema sp.]